MFKFTENPIVMIKRFLALFVLLMLSFSFYQCQTNDDNFLPKNLNVSDFVWKGMNLYYLWQSDVALLDDERFANQSDLNSFLAQNNDPLQLFQDLRTDNTIDRFSVIFSDYRLLEGILSGTTKNNGVEFGLYIVPESDSDIFGVVRYILPNSDASSKNIERGDIFYAINGQPLTRANYQSLLSNDSYILNMAEYQNNELVPNGEEISLSKTVYSENPILEKKILNIDNRKVGYIIYNGFYPNFESQLNDAFGELKTGMIDDLVLDLRYNSGGSIATATKLASMITGQFSGQVFAREQWNDKLQEYFEEKNPQTLLNLFLENGNDGALNHLELTKIYVLTSKGTASASELLINGLKSYIEVVQIGDNTVGKNVGSITLYDSPTFSKKDRDSKHFFAMQPIVLKVVNKDGFGDYQQNGLAPDQYYVENITQLGVLGTSSDPLLNLALLRIAGDGRFSSSNVNLKSFSDSKMLSGQDRMYRDTPEIYFDKQK